MKNPLLDAIKQMKAKRVAIVVGDADELGLPNMIEGVDGDSEEPGEEDTDPMEMQEDAEEAPEVPGEAPDEEDMQEGEVDSAADEIPGPAEKMMGRKPFDKKKPAGAESEDSGDGIPDHVASDLYDEDMVSKMRANGKKPSGLMARAQMNLAKRFGK